MLNEVRIIGKLRYAVEVVPVGAKGTQKGDVSLYVETYDAVAKDTKREVVNCVAWGKTAENLSMYAKEGDLLLITGKIATNESRKQDGTLMAFTNVIVNTWNNLSRASFNSNSKKEKTIEDGYENSLDIAPDDLPF